VIDGMVAVVVGARGNVGRHVAAGLRAAGEQVRVTSRTPGPAGLPEGMQVAIADLEQPESLTDALEGAGKIFLYAKPRGIQGFVNAATAAGAQHVVLLSSAAVLTSDPARNPIARDHRAVEEALERSNLGWTFIRPGLFATNTLWWWAKSIKAERVVRTPYPDAQAAPVHEQDLAALAVVALTEPGHEQQAYLVYGPQSLTLREMTAHIGDAIGHEIRLEQIPVDQARAELGQTMPPVVVESLLRRWASGEPAVVSSIVQDVTGHPARTFAQWAEDHADDFR
jgi:uncharacterized protein YbjT (DUF2867 family)